MKYEYRHCHGTRVFPIKLFVYSISVLFTKLKVKEVIIKPYYRRGQTPLLNGGKGCSTDTYIISCSIHSRVTFEIL